MRVPFWRLVRPGYSFLAEFAKAPDPLSLQGFLLALILDPQYKRFANRFALPCACRGVDYLLVRIESMERCILKRSIVNV